MAEEERRAMDVQFRCVAEELAHKDSKTMERWGRENRELATENNRMEFDQAKRWANVNRQRRKEEDLRAR